MMGEINFQSQEEFETENKATNKEIKELQQQQADLTMTLMMNGVI